MKAEDAKALAAEFETIWRDEFAALPDALAPLVRDLFVAMDELNHLRPADRRLTWVDVSFRHDGKVWKAYATPRVARQKWNAMQALHLMQALEGFNQRTEGQTWAYIAPRWSMDEIMDLAHKELDAIRDSRRFCDGETALEVEGFCQRWQDFAKELTNAGS